MQLLRDNTKVPQQRGMSAMLRRLAQRSAAQAGRRASVLTVAGLLTLSAGAQAAPFTKADNTTALTNAASYTSATSTVPTNADTIVFDSTLTAARTFSSGTLSVGALQFINPAAAQVLTINNGGSPTTLTIGTTAANTAIDMSAATQDFSILNGNALPSTLRLASLTGTRTFAVATGRTLTIGTNLTSQGNSQTLALTGGGNVVINGVVSSLLGLNINGANVTLNAANTFTLNGSTLLAINSGTLTLGNANALGGNTLTDSTANGLLFAGGIGTFNVQGLAGTGSIALADAGTNAVTLNVGANNAITTYSGVLSGAGGLTKVGTGTLTLSGASTNTGGLTVSAGQVTLGNNTAAGAGTITLNGGNIALNNSIVLGNAVAVNGTGTLFAGSAGQVTGALSSTAGSTLFLGVTSPNLLTLAGSMTGFNGTLSLGASTGSVRLNNSTNVNLGSTTTLFDLGVGTATLLNRNGSNGVFSLGGLQGGTGTFLSGASVGTANSNYSIGALNTSTTFAGTVLNGGTGATAITKVGTGTLTLTGANTYSGGTTISAGALAVSNASGSGTGSGAVTVSANGTLTGMGIISGAVTSSGTVNAGSVGTVGTLTTGAETFNPASSLVFDFGNNAVDELVSTGLVSGLSGANFVFNTIGDGTLTNPTYTLIAAGSFSDTTLPTSVTGTPTGYQLQFNQPGTELDLVQIAAAPEPSQWAAFTIGVLGLGGLALKARRRQAA